MILVKPTALSLGDGFISRRDGLLDGVAASLVEQASPSSVALGASLWRGPPRPRWGGMHQLIPATPVQNMHVLSDVVDALPNLFQHGCRKMSSPDAHLPCFECCAALSATPPNTAHGLSATGAAIARRPSFGWLWKWLPWA